MNGSAPSPSPGPEHPAGPDAPDAPAGPSRRQMLPVFGAAALAVVVPALGGAAAPASAAAPAAAVDRGPRAVYVGGYAGGPGAPAGPAVFRMAGAGRLTPVQEVPGVPNPSWLAVHPRLPVLYAVCEVSTWNGQQGGGVVSYAVDTATGELTRTGDQPVPGVPAHGALDERGEHLVVANYGGGTFAVVPLRADGTPAPVSDTVTATGTGPDPQRQAGPHPHQVVFDPAYGYVFGADLGTDRVWAWRLDAAAGKLAPNPLPFLQVASGSGARHLAFHPTGRFVYVVNELTSSVTAFSYDAGRGTFSWLQTVSTLPRGFTGESYCAEVAVHPDGGTVYVSNRGHDSIARFAVAADGRLDLRETTPTGGAWPRHFALAPGGDVLLVANQNSDDVVAFRVGRSGALRRTGATAAAPSPACVAFGSVLP
ncbi:lactonase family protein [Streptomyces synnematoformans]|uniref:Lactonase family protein n=1 Tax=Streptomyces synnematoformans TaxID=415721 RepID=A0ABN2XJV8_9ACTN